VLEILRLNDVTKSFSQGGEAFSILKGIRLTIREGEIVALVGPSGSGKSTLLQIAGLIDKPSSGQVVVCNNFCNKLSDRELTLIRRKYLGFVFQFHHLLPEFSAIENVAMPLMIAGVNKKDAFASAEPLLAELGLGNKHNNLPSQLSGGEQQRVSIARAFVHRPKIIFADEPTGSLDPNNGELVFKLFYMAAKKYNTSSLIVTHNIEIAKKADRILTISDGVLLEVND
jgi:lipoprotein-releasing system ATP-binding protein